MLSEKDAGGNIRKIRVGKQKPPGFSGSFTKELLVQFLGEAHADRISVNKTGFRVVKKVDTFFNQHLFFDGNIFLKALVDHFFSRPDTDGGESGGSSFFLKEHGQHSFVKDNFMVL